MFLWLEFIICAFLIVYSGIKLSKYGDILAEKTGLSQTWVGLVLMAAVTSLPEFVTGISSVTYAGAPDIAVGDVLGSCVFNLFILGSLDIFQHWRPLSAKSHRGHILSGGIGIFLLSIVALSLFAGRHAPRLGWVGIYSLLIAVIYFVAMRMLFLYERRLISAYTKEVAYERKYKAISMRKAVVNYGLNAFIVITAAVFLPKVGKGIAEMTNLGQTFVGNIFIAFSTSLPEVVVSISALKIGAIDLAVGNLLGSNIFNIFILALDDLLFVKGPILSFVSTNHIISTLSAISMTGIAVIGLTYRAEKKRLFLAWDSAGILSFYPLNLLLLYMMK